MRSPSAKHDVRQSGRAHYVKHNAVTRVPRSFIYLDTEAYRDGDERREVQTFRLAVAAHDSKKHGDNGWMDRVWTHSTDPTQLWAWIAGRVRAKSRTVLVAHNLAYDLRISDAFTHLPALGYEFVNGRIEDRQAWVLWRNGDKTLICVDSTAWVAVALGKLGEAIGIPKLDLPDDDDTQEAWFDRCTRDVEILAEVWRRLMAWVEADDLGNWRFSGAGQSWSALRHRFYTHRLFVHADDEVRAAERRAASTGRCEAWQHGKLKRGPYAEWDFTTAYARIGVECSVPVALVGQLRAPTVDKIRKWAPRRAILCDILVTTDVPTLHYRDDDGIRWPIGTFRTTVWENELLLAVDNGAQVTIERAWAYRRQPALEAFCTWILDGLEGRRGTIDPVIRIALKHWSRAIVGRMAAQWTRWDVVGRSPLNDVSIYRCRDGDEDSAFTMMQLGPQLMRERERPENPDASVAVMSWVMAESRVRLWRAMEVAGFEHVLYVDTDSLITNAAGSERLRALRPDGLRVKGEWSEIEILGPRQIIPGGILRAAGVPRGAVRVSEGTWEAEVWRGLSASLKAGESDRVQVSRRRFKLRGADKRRLHLKNHLTAPVVEGLAAVTAESA